MTADEGRLVAALRSAMKENARLREERDRADRDAQVAITAMACRLPGGADTPEALWELVERGGDAVGPLPRDRGWQEPGDPPRSIMREGAFLDRAGDFDAGFFGISPKEALATDPQQRLLLETSWEAIERARIDPASLRGTDTGVYVGLTAQEYGPRMAESTDDGLALTGTTASVASGRISYTLGLHGPSLSMDTACSSSLVALHSAVRALRSGECSMALAGGAAVMSSDGLLVEFTRKGGLSPDGRCRAFGADADGTGFSEGAVVLVLERVADARAAGRPVLAVVRGSAVNSDGASNGLTAPNGPAQARVIRAALSDAGLDPHEIDAVEAHGTGTTLGDPIEAQALVRVYGGEREEPLLLGSLKSNIGHAQAAAGAAGAVKAVQALRHGTFPSTLHAAEPSPHVDWQDSGIALAQTNHTWAEASRPRRIAVSSFGISGTNVHLILEQAEDDRSLPRTAADAETAVQESPTGQAPGHFAAVTGPLTRSSGAEEAPAPDEEPVVWPLSARGGPALHGQAVRLLRHLEHAPSRPCDVALSLATTRAHLEDRAVVVGAGTDELRRGLRALAAGESDPGVITGSADGAGPTAFLFTGQGSQRPGMGRELHAAHPVFARAFDEVAAEFDRYLERPLTDVVWAGRDTPEAELLDRTGWAQIALFTFGTALYRLLESWGVRPDYVAGHSIGEITAAHVCGVLTLPDAVRLVEARARLMQALPEGGAMAAVQAPPEETGPVLEEAAERTGAPVTLAAVNAPGSVVVSGAAEAVDHVVSAFTERGHRTRRLTVSHAFHSPLMDPMLEDFARVASEVRLSPPVLPLISNLGGGRAGEEIRSADYWVRHVREPVRFAEGIAHLRREGVTAFVEVGPDAALTAMVRPTAGDQHRAVALQSRLRPETEALATGIGEAHVAGVPVEWAVLNSGARTVDLPTYAFQHRRYWLDTVPSGSAPAPAADAPALDEAPAVPALRARLEGMSADLREEELLQIVRRESAVLLGHTRAQDVPADRGFLDLGFDSLAAVRLGARLGELTGLELPSTVLLDHPAPRAVATRLSEEIGAGGDGTGAAAASGAGPAPEDEPGTAPEHGPDDEEVDGMGVDDLVRMVYDN
ncbi:type I polyketide synthase [Nocardiopsis kunsanensis]|uniref:type I polyketide synthase n=1 Tax=Nocardiopsis kunsanensis TaxID=141693 RepID=UPI0003486195|nr:type I polyketide synthase [Nocardiopsis kunsanensis]